MSSGNRRVNHRTYTTKILIICAGETEVSYFNLLKKKFKNVDMKIIQSNLSDDEIVVNEAINKKLTDNRYHEVWAVFDKDHSKGFNKVIKLAQENSVKCAYSNIAFEYWYYLHFCGDNKEMKYDEIKNELNKYLKFYYDKKCKTQERVFNNIEKHLLKAEENAKRGHSKHKATYGDDDPASFCSCTTVYELVKVLKKWNLCGVRIQS